MCAHQKHGEDQRRCAKARREKKEMNWKKTLGFLLPGECQVICFVIPLHIFCSRENEPRERETRMSPSFSFSRKRAAVVLPSLCGINNSSPIIIISVVCCCCCCCCYYYCSALCSRWLCMCARSGDLFPLSLFHRRSFLSPMCCVY